MNFIQRRRYKKFVKHLLQESQHARNMREDLADEKDIEALQQAQNDLMQAWESRSMDQVDEKAEALAGCVSTVYPPRAFPKWRENIEIIAVALGVAMAFRTYFIQPFKIPTGSMQPTLNGITYEAKDERTLSDKFPLKLIKVALFGQRYIEVKAKTSGYIDPEGQRVQNSIVVYINDVPHEMNKDLARHFKPGQYVEKGQVLASGIQTFGDHIFVDKIRYNFSRPKRGDIIVFDTSEIKHPDIRPNTFYIKRCAGLPGDEISIDPPYLVVDGQKVTDPYPFTRLLNETDEGYMGYGLANRAVRAMPYLSRRSDRLKLDEDEYLPLGDNTMHSLDGRYFGPIKQEVLVGPAFCVYWPLGDHFGRVY